MPNRLIYLWERLIEPRASFQNNDERRRARLLSSIVILLFPVIFLVGIVLMPLISDAPRLWQSPTFFPATSALVISMIAYILNRAGYFRTAAALYIFIFIAAPFAAVTADISLNNIAIGTLMVGGVFLTTALFSNIYFSTLAIISVVGMTLLIPLIAQGTSLENIAALLAANITISLLILLYSSFRNGLEIHRHAQLNDLNFQLQESYYATLEGWARALELMDKETEGHTRRVLERTVKLATELGIRGEELENMRRGALLHDIGKMGIPESILLKRGKLTKDDWEIIRTHPKIAYDLLQPISFLRPALDIPYSHHEKWDGTGYPQGLAGEEIPLAARLFSVVDVWDALLSDRPYRRAWPNEKVLEYIKEQSGIHFDPECVDLFFAKI